MRRRNTAMGQQLSFPEAVLLRLEPQSTPIELPDIPSVVTEESPQPSTLSPTPDEMADLFGFISVLAQTKSNMGSDNVKQEGQLSEVIIAEKKEHRIALERLLEHYPDQLTHIFAAWNSMREYERLPLLENARDILAPQLVHPLDGSHTDAEVESMLLDCYRELETLGKLTHTRERCPERDGPPQIEIWEPAAGWTVHTVRRTVSR